MSVISHFRSGEKHQFSPLGVYAGPGTLKEPHRSHGTLSSRPHRCHLAQHTGEASLRPASWLTVMSSGDPAARGARQPRLSPLSDSRPHTGQHVHRRPTFSPVLEPSSSEMDKHSGPQHACPHVLSLSLVSKFSSPVCSVFSLTDAQPQMHFPPRVMLRLLRASYFLSLLPGSRPVKLSLSTSLHN